MVPGGVLTASVPQLFQIPQQGAWVFHRSHLPVLLRISAQGGANCFCCGSEWLLEGAAPIVAQSMPSSAVSSVGASAVLAESAPAKAVPGEARVPAGVVQAASTVAKADRTEAAEAKPQEAKSKTVGSLR